MPDQAPQNDSSESLREQIEHLHAIYITEHMRELDRLKPSMVRQYKLEAEISKVPTKFIKDLMALIAQYGIEQRTEALEHAKQAWENYLSLYEDTDASDVSFWFRGYIEGFKTKNESLEQERGKDA